MNRAHRCIGEPLEPLPGSFDTTFMIAGSPGLPREFFWRNEKFTVTDVLRTWRTTGPCHHGSDERYVRHHWFEIKTTPPQVMKIYFDKGTHGTRAEMGWYVFTVAEGTNEKKVSKRSGAFLLI